MAEKIYKDDYGHTFLVDAKTSLVGYTSVTLYVTKPSGTQVEWELTVDDEAEGKTSYIIEEGDLDESGRYKIYVIAILSNGIFTGNFDTFDVYERGK